MCRMCLICPLDESPRDSSLKDPSLKDPWLKDPLLKDPLLKDPSLKDPSLKEPSLKVEGSGVSNRFNHCTIAMLFFSYQHPKKPMDTSYNLFWLYSVISNNAVITHSILNFLLLPQDSLFFSRKKGNKLFWPKWIWNSVMYTQKNVRDLPILNISHQVWVYDE